MVPDVNKYAIRNGRAAAAWVSLTDTIARVKTKSADAICRIGVAIRALAKRPGPSILRSPPRVLNMGSLYHGSMANRKAKTGQFLLDMRVSRAAKASIAAVA